MSPLPAEDDPVARLDAAARRARTPCGAGELAWRRWGEGAPLVLLHGGHGSWTHWLRNIEALAATGRELLVPDMPGFGESAELVPAPGTRLDGHDIARPLAEGLDRLLGDRAFDLAGFSFGGVVAGHLAAQRPDRVRRLVVVGSGGLGLMPSRPLPLRFWRHRDDPASREAAHRHNLGVLMLADPAAIDPLAVRLQRENSEAARYTDSRQLSMTDVLARRLDETRPALAGIWGELDATVPGRLDAVAARLRQARPDARFAVVPRAGHWVQYEQPRAFEAALLEALA